MLPRQVCLARDIRYCPAVDPDTLENTQLLSIRPPTATFPSQNFNMPHQISAPRYDVVNDVNNDVA
ncbi:hypothetical protein GCM10011402_37260 [Paracoccus acridae]|uniref:Uncharacterized protein n=1 Tax=Paracoccus acridae TaxID=1795310 RepID=A0ABQ1VMF2_9RHOB|nr:hypothetical protein GCM10011402_37260 [Paracoccus acridae]